jgi:tetratricopeptide (TPR) repeat protein
LRTFFALALLTVSLGCASQSTPESEDAYRRGLSVANSDTAGAIKIFEDGLAADPKHHRMRFALARLQYDTGENQWLAERDAAQVAKRLEDDRKTADAAKARKEEQDRHQKALPFLRAARENLIVVIDNDTDQSRRAWAYLLCAKCDVFFEEFDKAADHLQKAIDLGRPTGAKLAQMQEFLASLKKEAKKRGT